MTAPDFPKNPDRQENDFVEKERYEKAAESEIAAPLIETGAVSSTKETEGAGIIPSPPPPSPPPPRIKSPRLLEVEQILSAGLEETYRNLPPEIRQKFKTEGERSAHLIFKMIESAKVQIKRVAELIRDWLKMIPGVNRFFLEQETKIKTDQIILLSKKPPK